MSSSDSPGSIPPVPGRRVVIVMVLGAVLVIAGWLAALRCTRPITMPQEVDAGQPK